MNRLRALGSDKITLSIERTHISLSCVLYSTNTDNYLSHLTALTLNFRLGLVSVSWVKSTHTSWMCWGRTDEDDITQRGLVRNRNAHLVGTISSTHGGARVPTPTYLWMGGVAVQTWGG